MPARNASRPSSRAGRSLGYTAVETSIALGIAGILATAAVSTADLGSQDLTVVQNEFRASLFEAFSLARAQGRSVVVALGDPSAPGIVPIYLPPRVKWGKPAFIPTPPGMDEPVQAGTTGSAHPRITVTPRHTATACAWFVNDGKEAVCMRLSGQGHIQVLRWSRTTKTWGLG